MKNLKFNFVHVLACVIVLLCFGYFFMITLTELTQTQKEIANEIKTALIGTITAILGYFYGSSKAPQDPKKNDSVDTPKTD